MAKSNTKPAALLRAAIRDFRAAPTKILRRAARTKKKVRLGDFVITVREAEEEFPTPALYGSMSTTGRVIGPASGLLSAADTWSTDSQASTDD